MNKRYNEFVNTLYNYLLENNSIFKILNVDRYMMTDDDNFILHIELETLENITHNTFFKNLSNLNTFLDKNVKENEFMNMYVSHSSVLINLRIGE